jgi:hypothetical protein
MRAPLYIEHIHREILLQDVACPRRKLIRRLYSCTDYSKTIIVLHIHCETSYSAEVTVLVQLHSLRGQIAVGYRLSSSYHPTARTLSDHCFLAIVSESLSL